MHNFALFARVIAKEGKEADVEEFLKGALEMAQEEEGTNSWYALKFDDQTFGIFDTFADEAGREAHLNGDIAKALMENAPELLAEDPSIEKVEVLTAK